ncbi:hypothetical protein X975_24377, partial [Stegodyphus mimosarum]
MDGNTDINDAAQLVLLIRGFENFEITKELACMQSLKGNFWKGFNFEKTNGAPKMTRRKSSFLGHLNQTYLTKKKFFLHCIIHQNTLCNLH